MSLLLCTRLMVGVCQTVHPGGRLQALLGRCRAEQGGAGLSSGGHLLHSMQGSAAADACSTQHAKHAIYKFAIEVPTTAHTTVYYLGDRNVVLLPLARSKLLQLSHDFQRDQGELGPPGAGAAVPFSELLRGQEIGLSGSRFLVRRRQQGSSVIWAT